MKLKLEDLVLMTLDKEIYHTVPVVVTECNFTLKLPMFEIFEGTAETGGIFKVVPNLGKLSCDATIHNTALMKGGILLRQVLNLLNESPVPLEFILQVTTGPNALLN